MDLLFRPHVGRLSVTSGYQGTFPIGALPAHNLSVSNGLLVA